MVFPVKGPKSRGKGSDTSGLIRTSDSSDDVCLASGTGKAGGKNPNEKEERGLDIGESDR